MSSLFKSFSATRIPFSSVFSCKLKCSNVVCRLEHCVRSIWQSDFNSNDKIQVVQRCCVGDFELKIEWEIELQNKAHDRFLKKKKKQKKNKQTHT